MNELPEGFVLDQPSTPAPGALPEGFVLDKPMAPPSTLSDIAKSGASGLAGGLVGAASMTPSLIGLGAQGLMKLNEMAGNPLQYISPGGTGVEQAQANKEAIAKAMGRPSYDFTPQTTPGGFAKSIGEFAGATLGAGLPGIGGTPGQIAKQVAGQVVAPGVASEAAGQATQGTPFEPYARAGAGLVAGAAGAGLTGPAKQGLTRAQVEANATKLYQSSELKSVEFTPQSIGTFADNLEQHLTAKNVSRGNVGDAFTAVDNLKKMATNGTATLANVRAVSDELTNAAGQVNARGGSTSDARAATIVKQQIRGYLDNLTQADLIKGDAAKIGPTLRAANQDYAVAATAFELPKTIRTAQSFAKKYDIPIEEALARRAKNLTPDEQAQAAKAVSGGLLTKGVRLAAMADPTKNPLVLGAHALGAYSTGGASLPLSTVGTVAGRLSDVLRQAQIRNLRQNILNRSYLASTMPPSTGLGVIPRSLIGAGRGAYGGILGSPYSQQQ